MKERKRKRERERERERERKRKKKKREAVTFKITLRSFTIAKYYAKDIVKKNYYKN